MKKILASLFVLSIFLPLQSQASAPTNGLMGYWKLDDNTVTTLSDSSGNSNTGGVKGGGSFGQGKLNKSVVLDGVDDYLDMGDSSTFEPSNFTISVWVKRNGAQADWVRIFNKGYAGGAPWGSYKLEFNNTSDTILNLHLGFTDGTAALVQSKTPLADGVWTNYTATYDGTFLKLYVNGAQEGNLNVAGKSILFDNVPLTFGGYNGFGYFKGELDEVRFYNRALSSQEVSDVFVSENTQNSNIEVYPGPGNNAYKSDLYSVEVFDGANWVPAYVYKRSKVSNMHWYRGTNTSVNFLTLGTNGNVNVRVSKIGGSISSAQVSPKSKNIPTQVSGGQAIITLKPNDKTWITLDGDDANPLFIFADALKPVVPSGATYFGPGVQAISPNNSNHYYASDNETIYLDGGAFVRGNIISTGKSNVQIMGPGILSGDLWDYQTVQNLGWTGMQDYFMIYASPYGVVGDTTVSGVTLLDSPAFNVYNAKKIYSTKVLSPWNAQTDGYNGVDIDNVFVFNGDTTFNNYMGYWNPATNSYSVNTKLTNSFGGTTNNAVILGGFYGNPPNTNFTSTVDNLDIKTYNDNSFVQYGAPHEPSVFQVWVDNNDSSYGYKNQIYQNIRIEGNVNAPLLQLMNRIYPVSWGGPMYSAKGNSYNIQFRNISLEGQQLDGSIGKKSEIKGLDANNGFHDVLLENVSIGGTVLNQSNIANYIEVNPYVWGLAFSPAPTVSLSASPTSINPGQSSTLTWSSTNATSCNATGSWSGTKSTSGSQTVSPTTISTYTLTCTNSGGGSSSKTVTVGVSQNSPIGFWTLDQSVGNIVSDSSGNNYTGILLNGPTLTTGKVGNALSFDSVDDQVKISTSTLMTSLRAMTVSTWINARTSGGNGSGLGTIFSKSGIVGSSAYTRLLIGSDGTSLQFNANYTIASGSWRTPPGSLSLNSWNHVVVTYTHNDINSVPKIYINGVLQSLTTLGSPSGNAINDDDTFYIGSRGTSNSFTFDGLIDQVRVYNRELSSLEVSTQYNYENSTSIDSIPPTVTFTSPSNGATVVGTTTLSVNATDNIGVAGVQFKIDGNNLGPEDIVSPFTLDWDTKTVVNGSHSVSALARDSSGNQGSSLLNVTVSNQVQPPPPVNKFVIGDKVKTTTRVNVRSSANGIRIGTQSTGAQGTITNGPATAGGLIWWRVNFNTGADGYVAENYLVLVSSVGKISSTLSVGSTGEEVSFLQETLKKLGYYANGITGYFGELTKSAVVQFQTANSLEAVGIVGPKTRALIENVNQN